MNILQLCKKYPFPLKDGEAIAVVEMSRALVDQGCQMDLLAMNTFRHKTNIGNVLPAELAHYHEVTSVDVDNQIRLKDAFLNLFSQESYHISRFVSEAFRLKLIDLLKNNHYDVIKLETLYLAPYLEDIKAHSDALIVMRAHNIEHEIWERIAGQIKFLPKRFYLDYLSKKLKNFELEKLNQYDFLVAITERDLLQFKSMGYKNGCIAAPVGFHFPEYKAERKDIKKPKSIAFIGSLDWMPNVEGLSWFLREAWPKVQQKFPELKFYIAGRNAPESMSHISSTSVKYVGDVEDAKKFINDHPIMVVPLLAGSGIRIKILEGMALGRVVITTSVGLEGIPAQHGKHVLLANTADEFVKAIEKCILNEDIASQISLAAENFVRQKFDRSTMASQIVEAYKQALHAYHS